MVVMAYGRRPCSSATAAQGRPDAASEGHHPARPSAERRRHADASPGSRQGVYPARYQALPLVDMVSTNLPDAFAQAGVKRLDPGKKCRGACGKLRDRINFHKNRRSRNGLKSICIDCCNRTAQLRRAKTILVSRRAGSGAANASRTGGALSAPLATSRDGLMPACRDCRNLAPQRLRRRHGARPEAEVLAEHSAAAAERRL